VNGKYQRKGDRSRGGPKGRGRPQKYKEQTRCRFCRSRSVVDYKDVQMLKKLCTGRGKLFSRKRSGNCAKHQRLVKRAVKYARYLAMLPYVG
jgi:small subunit ribosomal protein S18